MSSSTSSSSSDIVNLLDLAAATIASSISASLLIRDFCRSDDNEDATSNEKNIRLKEDGSFVTDADFAAQGIIVQSIRRISDQIRIVGEESAEDMAQHIDKYAPLINDEEVFCLSQQELYHRYNNNNNNNNNNKSSSDQEKNKNKDEEVKNTLSSTLPLRETILSSSSSSNNNDTATVLPELIPSEEIAKFNVEASKVCVFIDPLDATKSYAQGQYESVSILIGIVVDEQPCFGIICKPFGYEGLPNMLHAGCAAVYGGALIKGVYVAGSDINCQKGVTMLPTNNNNNHHASKNHDEEVVDNNHNSSSSRSSLYRTVISKSRSKGIVEDFCSHLGALGLIHPDLLFVSGAGEKTFRLMVRKNNEGLWFFPKPGTYLWDVAASDAILRQLGGKLTDQYGREMDYSKSRENAENVDGIIACIDSQLHADCIRILQEGDWL